METRVEVRKAGNELLPLLVLGLTSFALVGGISFAIRLEDTAESITASAQVAVTVLSLGALAMFAIILSRGRPYETTAHFAPGTVRLGDHERVKPGRAIFVLRDGDRYSVEVEYLASTLRLLCDDRDAAERLAGALAGKERVPTALYRLRKKADYYLFATTCCIWVLGFVGLVALPFVPVAGVVLLVISVPPAVYVTLKAVPTQVVVAPDAITLLHPLRVQRIPAIEVTSGRVVDDDSVRIDLRSGESLRLRELSDHPRDREATTSAPAAERLASALRELVSMH